MKILDSRFRGNDRVGIFSRVPFYLQIKKLCTFFTMVCKKFKLYFNNLKVILQIM